MRAAVVAALGLAALVTVAWLGRYEVLSAGGDGAVARLDRWTGRVVLCAGVRGCVELDTAHPMNRRDDK